MRRARSRASFSAASSKLPGRWLGRGVARLRISYSDRMLSPHKQSRLTGAGNRKITRAEDMHPLYPPHPRRPSRTQGGRTCSYTSSARSRRGPQKMPAGPSPGFRFAPASFKREIALYVFPELVGPVRAADRCVAGRAGGGGRHSSEGHQTLPSHGRRKGRSKNARRGRKRLRLRGSLHDPTATDAPDWTARDSGRPAHGGDAPRGFQGGGRRRPVGALDARLEYLRGR